MTEQFLKLADEAEAEFGTHCVGHEVACAKAIRTLVAMLDRCKEQRNKMAEFNHGWMSGFDAELEAIADGKRVE